MSFLKKIFGGKRKVIAEPSERQGTTDYSLIKDNIGQICGIWVPHEDIAKNRDLICALLAKHQLHDALSAITTRGYRIQDNKLDDRGGYFLLFNAEDQKSKPDFQGSQLRVGMSFDQVVQVLGQPTGRLSGAELLSRFGSVTGSASRIASIKQDEFCLWHTQNGNYELIFKGGKLFEIRSAP